MERTRPCLSVCRYGAHGISCQYLTAVAAELLGNHKPNVIIAHLGVDELAAALGMLSAWPHFIAVQQTLCHCYSEAPESSSSLDVLPPAG
jgi:Acetokinase family